MMAKLDAEVRKALGLTQGPAQPAAAAAADNGSRRQGAGHYDAECSPEPVKVPIAAKR